MIPQLRAWILRLCQALLIIPPLIFPVAVIAPALCDSRYHHRFGDKCNERLCNEFQPHSCREAGADDCGAERRRRAVCPPLGCLQYVKTMRPLGCQATVNSACGAASQTFHNPTLRLVWCSDQWAAVWRCEGSCDVNRLQHLCEKTNAETQISSRIDCLKTCLLLYRTILENPDSPSLSDRPWPSLKLCPAFL